MAESKASGQRTPRMSLAKVSRGIVRKPMRIVVYGPPGVGKSTFAAQAPSPIFLPTEDGTNFLDVARFPKPETFDDVIDAIDALLRDDHDYKTFVIDTIDWVEPLIWAAAAASQGKKNIEDIGYGKGFTIALDYWRFLFDKLSELETKKRMHIVILAHSIIKRVEAPDLPPYDQFKLKLHDKGGEQLKEYVDAVLFARHDVDVKESKRSKNKAFTSGERLLFTQFQATYDAKNRYGLRPSIPLDWVELAAGVEEAMFAAIEPLRAEAFELVPLLPHEEREKAIAFIKGCSDQAMMRVAINRLRTRLPKEEPQEPTAKVA